MRNAETVLGIIRERGKRGLPLEDIYRQLYNPDLYLYAYARLSSNDGAMTPGATEETVDSMSLAKIEKLVDDLRYERYRWTPVRRTYIPKKNGKRRPLGIATWSDKLLQEVMRLIFEAYYEPQFSEHSHGFRPGRGCHTALQEVALTWTGTRWFIEGDICQCFDSLDHSVLLSIFKEKLHDNRFLRLVQDLLQAGYLEDWRYNLTLSGAPQGGPLSPILSNIYLDKLDKYVEQVILPAYNRGNVRQWNKPYKSLMNKVDHRREKGRYDEAEVLLKEAQQLPSRDPYDPNYRRLYYVRYADDTLLGLSGSKAEAEEIKRQLREFLQNQLKLTLSQEKTLITHAHTQAARFLNYEIVIQQANNRHDHRGHRIVNGRVGLRVPADVVEKQCALYMRNNEPIHRGMLLEDADYSIISQYQSEYRGIIQYYLLAHNICWFRKLYWIMETSLLKTLASKHKASVTAMARKYRSTTMTPHGPMKCLKVVVERAEKKPLVTRFGGIPLRRQKAAVLKDQRPLYIKTDRTELIKRLLADTCEICGAASNCEVHHIRKLADLKQEGRKEKPIWVQMMSARRRKTLVVCQHCHDSIHAGRSTGQHPRNRSLESRVLGNPASPVRWGTDGKGLSNEHLAGGLPNLGVMSKIGRRGHDNTEGIGTSRSSEAMNTVSTTPMYGWNTISWKQIQRNVFKLQKRIYRASSRGDIRTVRKLQRLLMKSRSAKLLAVRRVTQDNQGKKTAGVDGVTALTPPQRLKLATTLSIGNKTTPVRRVWIPKPGTNEQRPLGIPIYGSYCTSVQSSSGFSLLMG